MIIKKFYDFNQVNESMVNEEITAGHLVDYIRKNFPKETPIIKWSPNEGIMRIEDVKKIFEVGEIYKYNDKGNIFYSMYELDPDGTGYLIGLEKYYPPKPTIVKSLIIQKIFLFI